MRPLFRRYLTGMLLLGCWFITGCHTYTATYTHPLYGSSTPYKTMPLKSDSLRSALYGSASLTNGNNNDLLRDRHFHLSGNLYQARQFSFFHIYYGANINAGSYKVKPYEHEDPLRGFRIDTAIINSMAGSKFFGAWGLNAGFTFTIPHHKIGRYGGEWRVLGIHASFQNEFGDYLQFRRQLDETAVTKLMDNNRLNTLGISTEWVFKSAGNKSLSMLFQYNLLLGREYQYRIYSGRSKGKHQFNYVSAVFHINAGGYSPFLQFNAGKEMLSANLGLNCRLAAFKKKG